MPGDPNDVAQTTRTAEVATAPVLTPTETLQVEITATPETQSPTEDGSGNPDDGTPSDSGSDDCGFSKGDTVQVTEDGVNLRTDPDATVDNVVEQMDAGPLLSRKRPRPVTSRPITSKRPNR